MDYTTFATNCGLHTPVVVSDMYNLNKLFWVDAIPYAVQEVAVQPCWERTEAGASVLYRWSRQWATQSGTRQPPDHCGSDNRHRYLSIIPVPHFPPQLPRKSRCFQSKWEHGDYSVQPTLGHGQHCPVRTWGHAANFPVKWRNHLPVE